METIKEIISDLFQLNTKISVIIAVERKIRHKDAENINEEIGSIIKRLRELDK